MAKVDKKRHKARRKMAGEAMTCGARGIEGGIEYTRDANLVHRNVLTAKEKKALDRANELLSEGSRILRVVGNHLANPRTK